MTLFYQDPGRGSLHGEANDRPIFNHIDETLQNGKSMRERENIKRIM